MNKSNWTYKKLVDECDILYGYPFNSKSFSTSEEDMPLIRIRDVKEGRTSTFFKGDYPQEYIIHKGDYLIGMDGEFNISPWKSADALLNQRVCKISCKTSNILMRFVYRFLVKELKKIEDETPFVTVKHLSAKKLNQIKLPIPPLADQERIVAELDLLSSIIEKKKAQLKELDQLAQSIFYNMFGDPITNEKGWEVRKLGEACKLMAGGDVPRERFSKEKTKTYSVPVFSNGIENCGLYGYTDIPKITEKSITISGRGTIGFVAKRKEPFYPIIRLIVVTPINDIDITYLEYYAISMHFDGNGVAIPQLTVPMIKNVPIPLPPLPLQQEFASKVEAIERQKSLIQQSIDEVQTMFDSRMDYWFG